jgi:hypothetical protein
MRSKEMALAEGYDPDRLLDTLTERLGLKNDAALAIVLGILHPVMSNIRHRRLAVGPSLLIRMHEASGLSVRELRALMGDHAESFRIIPIPAIPQTIPRYAMLARHRRKTRDTASTTGE